MRWQWCLVVQVASRDDGWIESAQRGGCEGLLDSCGVKGQVMVELDSPYSGALDIQWKPRPRH